MRDVGPGRRWGLLSPRQCFLWARHFACPTFIWGLSPGVDVTRGSPCFGPTRAPALGAGAWAGPPPSGAGGGGGETRVGQGPQGGPRGRGGAAGWTRTGRARACQSPVRPFLSRRRRGACGQGPGGFPRASPVCRPVPCVLLGHFCLSSQPRLLLGSRPAPDLRGEHGLPVPEGSVAALRLCSEEHRQTSGSVFWWASWPRVGHFASLSTVLKLDLILPLNGKKKSRNLTLKVWDKSCTHTVSPDSDSASVKADRTLVLCLFQML